MERSIKDAPTLYMFCSQFCRVLEKHVKYIIVSGFVAIASGRIRGTEDIDVIIQKISEEVFTLLHRDLVKAGFVCIQSDDPTVIYDYFVNKDSVRYTWKDRPVPEMEIKFTKDALDNLQLETRQKIKKTNLDVWFSSIAFNIAFKEEYLKSDKDLEDAIFLRKLYSVDEKEIEKVKQLIRRYRL